MCIRDRKNGVSYMFEASVGGGIPEIRGMRTSLAGDTVGAVNGILNGTTNYILTRMKKDGATFAEALSEAQRLSLIHILLIALYGLFVWRGITVARRAPDTFTSLTAFGITCQVGIQALLNRCV